MNEFKEMYEKVGEIREVLNDMPLPIQLITLLSTVSEIRREMNMSIDELIDGIKRVEMQLDMEER